MLRLGDPNALQPPLPHTACAGEGCGASGRRRVVRARRRGGVGAAEEGGARGVQPPSALPPPSPTFLAKAAATLPWIDTGQSTGHPAPARPPTRARAVSFASSSGPASPEPTGAYHAAAAAAAWSGLLGSGHAPAPAPAPAAAEEEWESDGAPPDLGGVDLDQALAVLLGGDEGLEGGVAAGDAAHTHQTCPAHPEARADLHKNQQSPPTALLQDKTGGIVTQRQAANVDWVAPAAAECAAEETASVGGQDSPLAKPASCDTSELEASVQRKRPRSAAPVASAVEGAPAVESSCVSSALQAAVQRPVLVARRTVYRRQHKGRYVYELDRGVLRFGGKDHLVHSAVLQLQFAGSDAL